MRTTFAVLTVTLLVIAAGPSQSAYAGAYYARACHADGLNSMWKASATAGATAYVQCPAGSIGASGLYARNVLGSAPASAFSNAGFTVSALPGTYFDELHFLGRLLANGAWDAGIYDNQGGRWLWCGPGCSASFDWYAVHLGGFASTSLRSMVICASTQCPGSGLAAEMALHNVTLRVQDVWNPAVGIAGGSLAANGWKRGAQSVAISANDNTGIRQVRAFLDGSLAASRGLACDDRYLMPCPGSPTTTLGIDVSRLAEGPHRLDVQAIDSGGNVAGAARTVYVDNRAPDAPEELATDTSGWSAANSFAVAWRQPAPGSGSPITGAVYQLCPESSESSTRCTNAARVAGTRIEKLHAPGPGPWRVKLWLVDEAGNENAQTSRDTLVRWDPDPPALRLADRDDRDPARIRAIASDATSGIAKREIEVRREGAATWHSLAVTPDERGFSAMADDERLKRGKYAIRVRATDQAGNVRSVDDAPMTLPVRVATKLRVGKPEGTPKRRKLQRRPRVPFGHTVKLSGRLMSPGGNPLANRDVDVTELTKVIGATWRAAGSVRTGKAGRFVFKAPAGPSRKLRFRYPGTATIRGRSATVHLRVRAASSMSVNRKRVVNGEAVTFTGRVRGETIPATGKLLQLQVFSRGSWRTFATPRTDPRGHWTSDYRFTATRGVTRYRFRVRMPREAGFPYGAGASHPVRVEVVGL